jgi:hypothetical protein
MTKLKQKLEQSDIRVQQFQVCLNFSKQIIYLFIFSQLMIHQSTIDMNSK